MPAWPVLSRPSLRLLSGAALGVLALAAGAQPGSGELMVDPSADALRASLVAPPAAPTVSARAFSATALPTTDGHCPGAMASSASNDGSRNLVVVPYGAPSAPHADLAIQFANNSDAIAASGRQVLDRVAAVLNEPAAAAMRFAVAGHTDATGTDRLNLELSCARAIAARQYLIQRGVAAQRLSAYGFGSQKPLEAGVTASAKNRRVEIRRAD